MRQRVRPPHHGHHRARHRQRGRPGLHHGRAGPAGAQRAPRCGGPARRWCGGPSPWTETTEMADEVLTGTGSATRSSPSSRPSPSSARPLDVKVAVIGAAGYVGRRAAPAPAAASRGRRVRRDQPEPGRKAARGGRTPRSRALTDARFSGATAGEAARGRDVVFLCLEHGESSRVAGEVFDAGTGTGDRPRRRFPGAGSAAVRALLRRAHRSGAGASLHLWTGRRAGPAAPRRHGHRRARLLRDGGAARALSRSPAPGSTSPRRCSP